MKIAVETIQRLKEIEGVAGVRHGYCLGRNSSGNS